ncbi:hypothetical protein P4K96_31625, partial [Bacillus cereus]|nr:hypothetical protein [Bacillus cereus]
ASRLRPSVRVYIPVRGVRAARASLLRLRVSSPRPMQAAAPVRQARLQKRVWPAGYKKDRAAGVT